jgi:16S rRNA (cytosine967-C5)-methyltransferase
VAIEQGGSYANLARAGLDELAGPDRGLAVELIGGVTRRRGTLDWYLGQLLTQPLAKLTPQIRNNLRMGAYQLLFLTRIPDRAAVDEAVKLARCYGHEGVAKLTNGVLRSLLRRREELAPPAFAADPVGSLTHGASLPAWLARRWHAAYGDQAEALGAWSVTSPKLALRVNTGKALREQVLTAFAGAGVEAIASDVAPEGIRLVVNADPASLPGYAEGWWYVQDEAAMLVARVVDPQPGEVVVDVGAAPGGKSTHLAALMGDRGEVWAVDRSGARLKLLAENARRLGLTIVKAFEADATDLSGVPAADRILLDVPCSGLGVLPRKPDLRWRQSEAAIAELGTLQGQLLDAAAAKLKPGGVLVYSTCTIGPQENQDVIRAFVARHPGFAPDDLAPYLPAAWQPEIEGRGLIQLLPTRHGVDGFFIARLRKG